MFYLIVYEQALVYVQCIDFHFKTAMLMCNYLKKSSPYSTFINPRKHKNFRLVRTRKKSSQITTNTHP